jgi:hypothetical protein
MNGTIRTLVILGSVASTACFHYVPVLPETAPQGTPVRARLTRTSAFELPQITVNNIDQVEGEVVRADGSELILSATWLQAVTGNGFAGNGWTVTIPGANVAAFEEKRLSWWRSGLVVTGILVGTWFGFDALGIGPASGGGHGGPGQTQ